MSGVAALLLADGRFPAGGHAHSGGLEEAVGSGRVHDLTSLSAFVRGRLATAGRVAAAIAAAACAGMGDEAALDAEADARMASPALREASRRQGRQLLRTAGSAGFGHPDSPTLTPSAEARWRGPHHAVAMGVVAVGAGMSPMEAARWAAYEAAMTPATAGVRLLGFDPYSVVAMVSGLAPDIDEMAREAAAIATTGDISRLPCCASPLLEIGAEVHRAGEVKLFAS